jgi:hypothetical protein
MSDPTEDSASPVVVARSVPYKPFTRLLGVDLEYADGQLSRFKDRLGCMADPNIYFKPRDVDDLLRYIPDFCSDLKQLLADSEALLAYLRTFPTHPEPVA